MIVVVVEPQRIRPPPISVGPSRRRIQPLRIRAPSQRRNRVHNIGRIARPVQPHVQIVLSTPPPAAPPPPASTRGSKRSARSRPRKIVDQPQTPRVAIAVIRSHIV